MNVTAKSTTTLRTNNSNSLTWSQHRWLSILTPQTKFQILSDNCFCRIYLSYSCKGNAELNWLFAVKCSVCGLLISLTANNRHRRCWCSRTGWRHTCSAAATKLFIDWWHFTFLVTILVSGPCNSLKCLGHFKHGYDDDDDDKKRQWQLNSNIPRQLPAASTCWYVEAGSMCLSGKTTTSRLDHDRVFRITSACVPAPIPFVMSKQNYSTHSFQFNTAGHLRFSHYRIGIWNSLPNIRAHPPSPTDSFGVA